MVGIDNAYCGALTIRLARRLACKHHAAPLGVRRGAELTSEVPNRFSRLVREFE